MFTDAARTVPVSSTPSPIGGILDISGSENHWAQDISSNRMNWVIRSVDELDKDVIVSPVLGVGLDFDHLRIPLDGSTSGGILVFFQDQAFYAGFKDFDVFGHLRFAAPSAQTSGVLEVVVLNRGLTTGEKTFFIDSIADERRLSRNETLPARIDQRFQNWRFLEDFPALDASAVTNAQSAWRECRNLKVFPDIEMPLVTNINAAWQDCRALEVFPPINFPEVTTAVSTWEECRKIAEFPAIALPKCTNFERAWYNNDDLLTFPHNAQMPLGQNFTLAWARCDKMTNFGIGPENSVISMSAATNLNGAWSNCTALTGFPLINTANVTSLGETFGNFTSVEYGAWQGCTGLTTFPILNTSNVSSFEQAWRGCTSLSGFPLLNVASGVNFRGTWFGCTGFTSFPPIALGTTSTMNINLSGAWRNCTGLTSFPIIDTNQVWGFGDSSIGGAWQGCSGLSTFPVLNTSNGTRFDFAWDGCTGLTSFPSLNTSSGHGFWQAWGGCSGLVSFPAISFTGVRPTDVRMFFGTWINCTSLVNFPANMFDNVRTLGFERAFRNCALNQQSVDNILVSVNAQSAAGNLLNGKLDIHLGTNATPSTTGQAAADALRGRGWTVNLNGY